MRIVFLGSGEIGLPTLRFLQREHQLVSVVAQPDKPAGRKQTLLPPATKTFALEHGIPVLQPRRIRDAEAVAEIAALEPELIVVMAYGQILPAAILTLAPAGCLNLHASLLPKYRGAAPIQAAIEAGETESGITVMWMDEGLDTGAILLPVALPIRPDETGGSLHDRLGELAPEALREALALIASGKAPKIPQENKAATYAPKLTRESGAIRWEATGAEIDRKIRAMNPWPAAYTLLPQEEGAVRRLKIFSAREASDSSISKAHPGEVLRADERGLLVATGEGALLLEEVQLEGKRRMHAGELLRGHAIVPGTRLSAPLPS